MPASKVQAHTLPQLGQGDLSFPTSKRGVRLEGEDKVLCPVSPKTEDDLHQNGSRGEIRKDFFGKMYLS